MKQSKMCKLFSEVDPIASANIKSLILDSFGVSCTRQLLLDIIWSYNAFSVLTTHPNDLRHDNAFAICFICALGVQISWKYITKHSDPPVPCISVDVLTSMH